ncbi:MAG TPA: hypothetical protein VE262_04790 [Blastocatellia bacterium]|nr:hypothetical protein [Blastocatellia bacterium]
MKDRTDKGIIDETRRFYDQMVGEVTRLAERDREEARRRGPMAKALFAACFLAGVLAALTCIYGVATFRDAPIRQTGSGYAGKHGAPHTREHYEKFKLWEKCMAVTFGLTFLTGFGAVAADRTTRRK